MVKPDQIRELLLYNDPAELEKLNGFLLDLSKIWSISAPNLNRISLALEEVFVNIIKHGFRDNGRHEIELIIEKFDDQLIIVVKDDGIPFNPLEVAPLDVTLPIEERQVGGLGILLFRKMMDKVEYSRRNRFNILTMQILNYK